MKNILIVLLLFAVILLTGVSCSTTRDVRMTERSERVDDDGVVIKKKKTVRDGDKDVTVKVRKERDRPNRVRDRDLDEPVIIIKKDDDR